MIGARCRFEKGCRTFVAVGKGLSTELLCLEDGCVSPCAVAEFTLESNVVDVYVCCVYSGILVTSLTCRGVGWSWVDAESWTVEKTEFQEMVVSSNLPQSSTCDSLVQCGCITYVEAVRRFILTLDHRAFLSSEIDSFNCDLTVERSLSFLTGIGMGMSGNGLLLNTIENPGLKVGRGGKGNTGGVSASIQGSADWEEGVHINRVIKVDEDSAHVVLE